MKTGRSKGVFQLEYLGTTGKSNAGLIYITAFPTNLLMAKYLSEISWETEVWIAKNLTHLIHFDGKRFLGPYVDSK